MNWLGFGGSEAAPAEAARIDIPLFPLNAVLFPGGVLALKVFEQRYLDMAAACLKGGSPFGVCLIASGQEVGAAALPHTIGTLAQITQADMPQLGILLLTVRGGRRFRIVAQTTRPDGLLRAQVELLAEAPPQIVPAAQQGLLPLLQKIAIDLGPEKMPEPHDFDDAAWVGYRLSEVLPVQAQAKQKLLELPDPLARLEIVFAYLAQRQLVE